MKGFLALMFAIPVLSIAQALWGRFKERHTRPLGVDGTFQLPRWIIWHEGESWGGPRVEVFHARIPWVRQWKRSATLANFTLGCVEGWHWLLVVRYRVFDRPKPRVFWSHTWLPCDGCVEVPHEELFRGPHA